MALKDIATIAVKDFEITRHKRKFTAEAIKDYLTKHTKYSCEVVPTKYSGEGRWSRSNFWETVKEVAPQIPVHFTYIKFYTKADTKEPEDDKIYALVAGKTQFKSREILFQVMKDSKFRLEKIDYYKRKDKAKKWLGAKEGFYRWCYEKIMIVWDPKANELSDEGQENLAYSVEADIGGLFGLFTS